MTAIAHYEELHAWLELRTATPAERNVLSQVADAERTRYQDPVAALAVLDGAVHTLDARPVVHAQVAIRLYTLRGDVHWDLYQYIDAVADWRAAQAWAGARERAVLDDRVAQTQRHLELMNKERNQDSVYLASPDVGPAAILSGRIAVAYVFVQDRHGDAWGLRDRELALASWGMAEAWLAARARQYGASVRFTRRLFVVDHNAIVRRLQVGYGPWLAHNDLLVARLVTEQLGAPSMMAFLESLKQTAGADQAVMILHIARDDRSLSWRCF
ncbi:MAG TPA: hypothetical protein VFD76_09410, partial [Gemmatimonadales bacterium]|nr:hypothetical protein [Gemmatimonadales bacterium]